MGVWIAVACMLAYAAPTNGANLGALLRHHLSRIRFAIIGDYGRAGAPEQEVANLVKGWRPDFILTTGDNDYPAGQATTMQQNIGLYYGLFMASQTQRLGARALSNRFFPSLGNHDWQAPNAKPYVEYFNLPGNERYYTFTRGPVQFFALDSDPHEPDGTTAESSQGHWLRRQLEASHACWHIAYFHHPPYSSGSTHGSSVWMQWPFREWGVDLVVSGHEHQYERLLVDGLPYVVNGAGGSRLYPFGEPIAGSQVRYNDDYGAMLIEAIPNRLTLQFRNRTDQLIDVAELQKSCR